MHPIVHNAVQAIAETAADVGLAKEADEHTAYLRFMICKQCQFLNPDNTCQQCGCAMDKKTGWDSIAGVKITCPMGYW